MTKYKNIYKYNMQKVVNGHLYVFDLTPFEITENTDASVIFVQNECLDGYKELNVSLAAKMKGFNQFLLCVQKQEWSMPADPVDGGLEWSASTATVRIGDTNSYPTLINPNELEVTYSSSNESVATIDSTGAITLVGAGSTNITVESAAEPGFTADSASYALTVLAALVSPELAWSANSATVSEDAQDPVLPTLTNTHNLPITYSSSDTSVARIHAATGDIIIESNGTTTITAAYAGGDIYYAQSVSYTLTVEAAQQVTTYTLRVNTQDFIGDEALYVEGVNNPQFNTDISVPEGAKARIYVNHPEWYVLTYDAVITAGEGPYTYNGHTYEDYILVFGWNYEEETGVIEAEGTMPAEDFTEDFICQAPTVTIDYNIQTAGEITLWQTPGESDSDFEPDGPDAMYVDGVEVTPSETYTFDTTGNHTVMYVFSDGILDASFDYVNTTITNVIIGPYISEIRGACWRICDDVSNTYLPTYPPTIAGNSSDFAVPQTTIYVPADALPDYYQAEYWSDISNQIQEIPGSGESGESGES